MQEVYEFLKYCGTYYLATVQGDQPRVRPFGTVEHVFCFLWRNITAVSAFYSRNQPHNNEII